MTIALGILATDGVVVAADSQVTSPGFFKVDQGKISSVLRRTFPPEPISGPGGLIVAGAGTESSISYLRQRLTTWFSDQIPVPMPNEVEAELANEVLAFYDTHATPHGRAGDLDAWMLVAAFNEGHKGIWTTERSMVLKQSMFAAAGAGEMYARSLLGKIYVPMNTLAAILVASYIIFEVKQFIDGCGNETDITAIRSQKIYYVDRDATRQLEDVFRRYSRLSAGVLHTVLFDSYTGTVDVPGKIGELRAEIARIER